MRVDRIEYFFSAANSTAKFEYQRILNKEGKVVDYDVSLKNSEIQANLFKNLKLQSRDLAH